MHSRKNLSREEMRKLNGGVLAGPPGSVYRGIQIPVVVEGHPISTGRKSFYQPTLLLSTPGSGRDHR